MVETIEEVAEETVQEVVEVVDATGLTVYQSGMKMKDSLGNPRDKGLSQATTVRGKIEGGSGSRAAASLAKKTDPFLLARPVLGDKAKKEQAENASAPAEPGATTEPAPSPDDIYGDY